MAEKRKGQAKRSSTVKPRRPVAIDEQNPASTNVQALVEALVKRKEQKKKQR